MTVWGLLLALVGFTLGATVQDTDGTLFNTPTAVEDCLAPLSATYHVSARINPFYLRGDFDGDGRQDHAVLVTDKEDRDRIAVCWGRARAATILDEPGLPINMADRPFDAWMVHPKGIVGPGVEAGPPPKLKGDALLVIWSERASGLLYWDGKSFRWYQQGD